MNLILRLTMKRQILVVLFLVQAYGAAAMSNCDTQGAICNFNGRLRGSIKFQEKHGFGCSSFGEDEGLHMQINIRGFDPEDGVTAHNFRIKSYAGLNPNCTGMGADFGQGLRGPDLGTFRESQGGVIQIADVTLKNGPTVIGKESVVGRSVAVYRGQSNNNNNNYQAPQVLGCCIIGMANPQQVQSGFGFPAPSRSFPNNRNQGGGSSFNFNNPAPSSPSAASPFSPFSSRSTSPQRQSAGPTFNDGVFRSPFGLDGKLSFFDLSGKTAGADSIVPDKIKDKFLAPEAPQFRDIYGLAIGESPLARSGKGQKVRPSKDNSFSRMFFDDPSIKTTGIEGLTAEEMSIPRETESEETESTYHANKVEDTQPGYDDAGPGGYVSPGGSDNSDTTRPVGLSSSPINSDSRIASFLPTDDDSLENIDISKNYQNGVQVDPDTASSEGQSQPSATSRQDPGAAAGNGGGGDGAGYPAEGSQGYSDSQAAGSQQGSPLPAEGLALESPADGSSAASQSSSGTA